MNFIALGVIAEIDNVYLKALPSSELMNILSVPVKIETISPKIEFLKRDLKN
jgi:hypothetical protein